MKTAMTSGSQAAQKSITWNIDPAHSRIEFSVSHMVISHVKGNFKNFDGTLISEGEDFENAKIELSIDSNSIDTNNEQRDAHLRSNEFIDTARFPNITFKSTSVKKKNESTYIITGDFSVHGISRQIELNAKYNGSVKDPYQNTRAGFKVTGEINRKDFGINWHAALDSGGLVAGDTIEIIAHIEIVHK